MKPKVQGSGHNRRRWEPIFNQIGMITTPLPPTSLISAFYHHGGRPRGGHASTGGCNSSFNVGIGCFFGKPEYKMADSNDFMGAKRPTCVKLGLSLRFYTCNASPHWSLGIFGCFQHGLTEPEQVFGICVIHHRKANKVYFLTRWGKIYVVRADFSQSALNQNHALSATLPKIAPGRQCRPMHFHCRGLCQSASFLHPPIVSEFQHSSAISIWKIQIWTKYSFQGEFRPYNSTLHAFVSVVLFGSTTLHYRSRVVITGVEP